MSPFNGISTAFAGLHWGWKAAGAVAGGVAATLPLVWGLVQAPISQNSAAIEVLESTQIEDHAQLESLCTKVDKILCNMDPDETWHTCELKYGNGS